MRSTLPPSLLLLALLTTSCSPGTPTAHHQPFASPTQSPIITRLVSQHQTLTIRSTPTGPTYSLESNDGTTLIPPSTLNDLALTHPDLFQKVRTLQATTAWAGL